MKDHQRTKNLVLAAMLVAILVILGLLPGIPLGGIIPVPLVLQNMGVMLAGGLLGGSKYGTAAVGLFLLLVFWDYRSYLVVAVEPPFFSVQVADT